MPRASLPPGCPEPDLQSRPSRSGACCSPGPSGSGGPREAQLPPSPFLFVLHLPGDLRVGLHSSEREQALPPPPSFLGVHAAVRGGKGRNASFPAAWLRPGPRWERRHCGAHTCELALEVSGCGRAPLPVPQGFHLSASESAQVALAPAPGPVPMTLAVVSLSPLAVL